MASADVRPLSDELVAGSGVGTCSAGQTPITPGTSRSWSASALAPVTDMPLYALVNDAVRRRLSPSVPASLSTLSCEAFAADAVPPSAVEAPLTWTIQRPATVFAFFGSVGATDGFAGDAGWMTGLAMACGPNERAIVEATTTARARRRVRVCMRGSLGDWACGESMTGSRRWAMACVTSRSRVCRYLLVKLKSWVGCAAPSTRRRRRVDGAAQPTQDLSLTNRYLHTRDREVTQAIAHRRLPVIDSPQAQSPKEPLMHTRT